MLKTGHVHCIVICMLPSASDWVCIAWLQLAIYSPADRLQPHRYKADESYQVGSPDLTPVQCYLDIEGILALAK